MRYLRSEIREENFMKQFIYFAIYETEITDNISATTTYVT